MTIRRLSILQWFGLAGGAAAAGAQFLAGTGTSQAVCNPGSGRWGIPHDAVELTLMGGAILVVLAAEAAAVTVFRATRGVGEHDPPPEGRLHFFSAAALVANLVFLMIVLLTGIATVVDRTCQQS